MNKANRVEDSLASEVMKVGYDHVPLWVIGAFCTYVFVWFLQLGGRIAFLGAIRFEFILGSALIGIAFLVKRQGIKVKAGLGGYLVLFFFALMTQIPYSYNVDYSWTIFVDRVIKFACMSFFIVMFVRNPTTLRFFIFAFLLAWLKMGQEGLVGQITGSLVWQNQGVLRLHGATPNYAHPNSFSGFALGALPFAFYLLPVANRWQKVLLVVMIAFALNIILFTGSRTGYIGFLLFALYLILRSKHRVKVFLFALLIGLAALPVIPDQYVERFKSITGHEAQGQSKLRRVEILQDALVIFSEHPFGVGVAAFPTIREQRFGRYQDTHNLYLEVATNLGIQGFIIWAMLIVAMFRASRRIGAEIVAQLNALAGKMTPESTAGPLLNAHVTDLRLMLAMLHAANAYVIIRLVVGLFGMDLYEIYWWFALGIIISIHNLAQAARRITTVHLQHLQQLKCPAPATSISIGLRQLHTR